MTEDFTTTIEIERTTIPMNSDLQSHHDHDHDRAFLRTLLLLVAIAIVGLVIDSFAHGQQTGQQATGNSAAKPSTSSVPPKPTPKPEFEPTEIQRLKLENLQLRAVNAQQAWNSASLKLPEYGQFQASVNSLTAECKQVAADNHWPADVECNINVSPITFGKQPAASAVPLTAPAAAGSRPEAKK